MSPPLTDLAPRGYGVVVREPGQLCPMPVKTLPFRSADAAALWIATNLKPDYARHCRVEPL